MADRARLAVDEPLRGADLAPECLHDRLVAEADAERRHARPEAPHDLDRRAGVARAPRPRRDQDMAWRQLLGRVRVDRVVPVHGDLAPERAEQVREVVGEGVVVVDEENHRRASASRTWPAVPPAGQSPAPARPDVEEREER